MIANRFLSFFQCRFDFLRSLVALSQSASSNIKQQLVEIFSIQLILKAMRK